MTKQNLEVMRNNLKWKLQISTRPHDDKWQETTLDDLVDDILRITGHLPEEEINYPAESEVTGTDRIQIKAKMDWIDSARSKSKEDENHLRVEQEENK